MNYYLSNFVILDMLSQAQAIAKYVRGWDRNRILSWIEQRGALTSKTDVFGKVVAHVKTRTDFDFR